MSPMRRHNLDAMADSLAAMVHPHGSPAWQRHRDTARAALGAAFLAGACAGAEDPASADMLDRMARGIGFAPSDVALLAELRGPGHG